MKYEPPQCETNEPLFAAFVYPGWHRSPYRPGVVERDLLANFRPYFPGHCRPPMPANGPYDDTDPDTAETQVRLASQAGIRAFMYFLYYGPDGFVMDEPMNLTFSASEKMGGDFMIAGTWCVRLPHAEFPVAPRDELELCAPNRLSAEVCIEDKPIELLTLRDLETLFGKNCSWTEIELNYQTGRPSKRSVGADRSSMHNSESGGEHD